ncbi:hypothetical protein [Photobacterium kishitanii]|uniref:hypothetical protein n=1 Tax=Photobacterium kishitanii TaxID=318456 RepID=UPI0011B22B1D|nr:hypothetical protein [Photobacterium kishitanii]
MFIRHSAKDHLNVLWKLFLPALVISILIINFHLIPNEGELPPSILFIIDILISSLDLHKVIYILITGSIAFITYDMSDSIVNFQNKRTIISEDKLKKELKQNTRAVVITFSNALSTIFKLLISLSIILITFRLSSYYGEGVKTDINIHTFIIYTFIYIALDIALFFIQKHFLSKEDNSPIINTKTELN